MLPKKIILAGGSGFIGKTLTHYFEKEKIIVFSRNKSSSNKNVKTVYWDAKTLGPWQQELEQADAIINLTGKSINCRHTPKNKKELLVSRVDATTVIGKAVAACAYPPKLWINASAIGIYKKSLNTVYDEYSTDVDTDSFSSICTEWEKAFYDAPSPQTRKVILRLAMVLGKDGGSFPVLSKLTKYGLGGKAGSGNQYISWVHEKDLARIIEWVINNKTANGIYNCSSPEPLTNQDFMSALRMAMHQPIGLPAYEWMIKIGAWLLQTEPGLVLDSRKVISKKLLESGFTFQYSPITEALKKLVH